MNFATERKYSPKTKKELANPDEIQNRDYNDSGIAETTIQEPLESRASYIDQIYTEASKSQGQSQGQEPAAGAAADDDTDVSHRNRPVKTESTASDKADTTRLVLASSEEDTHADGFVG